MNTTTSAALSSPSPPGLRAVKPGAPLLCFVSLVATLSMALYTTLPDFAADLALLHGSWQTVWQNAWKLGTMALTLFSAPSFLWFSLRLALHPRCSWRTMLGWSYAAAFYDVFIWFTRTRLHIHLNVVLVPRIDTWYIAVVSLAVALFLATRDLLQLSQSTAVFRAVEPKGDKL